jgi:hypothetical protein
MVCVALQQPGPAPKHWSSGRDSEVHSAPAARQGGSGTTWRRQAWLPSMQDSANASLKHTCPFKTHTCHLVQEQVDEQGCQKAQHGRAGDTEPEWRGHSQGSQGGSQGGAQLAQHGLRGTGLQRGACGLRGGGSSGVSVQSTE